MTTRAKGGISCPNLFYSYITHQPLFPLLIGPNLNPTLSNNICLVPCGSKPWTKSFKIYNKQHANGFIERYKARLAVAKGYLQTLSIKYGETFSLVIKSSSIRVVLTLSLTWQLPIRQLDVSNVFPPWFSQALHYSNIKAI